MKRATVSLLLLVVAVWACGAVALAQQANQPFMGENLPPTAQAPATQAPAAPQPAAPQSAAPSPSIAVPVAPQTVGQVVVPRGTTVDLALDQPLSSKTAQVGQRVALHVTNNVSVNGAVIIAAGTPVQATVESVSKRKIYGINGHVRLAFEPVRTASGQLLALQPRDIGKTMSGKTGEAAAATIAGAALLGPVGLVAGFFIHGKPATAPAGQMVASQVSQNTMVAIAPTTTVAAAPPATTP